MVIQPLSTAPSNAKAGQIYYNTVDKLLYSFDGTVWSAAGAVYVLPPATTSTLGGVIVGTGLSVDASGNLSIDEVDWEQLTNTPTTISGYAITDAKIENGVITLGSATITPVVDVNYVHTDNNFTNALLTKLDGIEAGAQENVIESISVNGTAQTITSKNVNITVPTKTSDITNDSGFITASEAPVQSVAGRTGAVVLSKSDVGLGNVDNTSDANKPVSTAQQAALDLKLDLAGGTMTGAINMGGFGVTNMATPSADADAATKKYVDDQISDLGAILNFKGTVATTSALPTTGMSKGDVYIVTADNSEWVWISDSASGTSANYEKLGPTIDLSGYLEIANLANGTGSSTTTAMTQAAVTNALSGLIKTATGTIGTSATSATVAYSGTVIATRTVMSGAEVVTEVAIGGSSVVFTTAQNPTAAVTCTVIYV